MTRRSSILCVTWLVTTISGGTGCTQPPPRDAYLISGLRILGVKASPPEVTPGQTTQLTVLAVDNQGRAINVDWAYCTDNRPSGQKVNYDCVTNGAASYLTSFGSGMTASLVMPMVDAATLGSADRTGGVYLPVRLIASAGNETTTAIYYLRVGMGGTANANPTLSGVLQVTNSGTTSATEMTNPLDPVASLPVKSGDKLTLRGALAMGSAELYLNTSSSMMGDGGVVPDGGTSGPTMSSENLSLAWFTTAGTINTAGGMMFGPGGGMMGGPGGGNGATVPDVTLTLDTNLPTAGSTIDLWVVGRDNRGGTDYQHRTLTLQ